MLEWDSSKVAQILQNVEVRSMKGAVIREPPGQVLGNCHSWENSHRPVVALPSSLGIYLAR